MASRKERVAAISAIASGTLALAKFVVGVIIGSLALISDALHSLTDLAATLVTWFAVRKADKPPDDQHHYGHGKIESVAALAQAALLFVLAGGIALESTKRLLAGGSPVTFSWIPFIVLGVEMVVNGWRAHVLRKTARETKSQALEADSLHFASDLYGSLAVIAGLVLAAYGYYWGDAAAALVVALVISVLGAKLGWRTIQALVDTAPAGMAERVTKAVRTVGGVIDVERVRLRAVGSQNFVETVVTVPRTLPLDRVAVVKADVQRAAVAALGDADVTVSTTPIALDDETVQERVMVIARNRGLAVHHLTVHSVGGRLAVAVDIEVDGNLTLGRAHEIASDLETGIRDELGAEVEVETHIEPLQTDDLAGQNASPERVAEVQSTLARLAEELGTVREVHNVRVRATKEGEIVNFHCRVDPNLTVQEVHEKVDEVERALRRRMPAIKRVIGHAEPVRAPAG